MVIKRKQPQTADVSALVDSSRVTISADLPISQLQAGVSRILALTDSAALTIRGDAKRIASAVIALGERVNVSSARLSISGTRGSSPAKSIRGDRSPE